MLADDPEQIDCVKANHYAPPPAPPCNCKETGIINICPLCVGGLMPLVYVMILYCIYVDLGADRTIEFAKMVLRLSWRLFGICLAVTAGAAFLFAAAVLVYAAGSALIQIIRRCL